MSTKIQWFYSWYKKIECSLLVYKNIVQWKKCLKIKFYRLVHRIYLVYGVYWL